MGAAPRLEIGVGVDLPGLLLVVLGIGLLVLGPFGVLIGLHEMALGERGLLRGGLRGLVGAATTRGRRFSMPGGDDAALITPLAATPGRHHRDRRRQKHTNDDGDDQPAGCKECHWYVGLYAFAGGTIPTRPSAGRLLRGESPHPGADRGRR
jgi:hypothetical protein